jgi:anti-sigma B factor antagonist
MEQQDEGFPGGTEKPRVEIDRSEPTAGIVVLRGEHDEYTALKLQLSLVGLLEEGRALIVDLTEATFVDSTVVGVLLAAREQAEARGTKLLVVMDETTGPAVRRLFDLAGLRSVLPAAESRGEALAACACS